MEVTTTRTDLSQLPDDYVLEQIIGASPAIRELKEQVRRFAKYSVNVLIAGPTGTGKEVIARTIHKLSPRRDKPFIPVDCAAVTGTLFASQMFGHLKGAFTGASYTALGCFRAAEGGTVFLDEIGEMELALQAKLLRALQQRAVVPVGGHEEVAVDTRVIAATNRDLIAEVGSGNFREDLYYRLNVVQLNPPPLVQRRDDIPLLASYFLDEMSLRHGAPRKTFSHDALRVLRDYSWPGNVRQLQNLLERVTVGTTGAVITAEEVVGCLAQTGGEHLLYSARSDDAAAIVREPGPAPEADASELDAADEEDDGPEDGHWHSLEEVQRSHIELTLERTYHNQSAAAELLRIDRSSLRRLMKKLGMEFKRSKRGRPRQPR